MEGFENDGFLIAYVVSNLLAVLFLYSAWRWPRLSRLLFAVLFMGASLVNWNLALTSPSEYLRYADLAILHLYRDFISGWFSNHVLLTVGFIATAQGMIAIALLLKGSVYRLGVSGAILFFLSIAPLGVGSALPCTLLLAWATMLLWSEHSFVWQYKKLKYVIMAE